MKNQLRFALGRLASIEFQRRLCMSGTASEYILPDEIFDSATNTVETVLSSPLLSETFNASELKSLREFLAIADASATKIPFNSSTVSVEELVETDPEWDKLRAVAQRCLDALGLTTSLDELLKRS